MSSSVFGAALALGVGIAFLLAQLRPVFFDRRQLAEVSGVPVIGSVNMIWVPQQRFRKRLANFAFIVGMLGLVAAYAAVLAVFMFDVDVLSRLPF
jgi:hypothetical protein